MKTVIIASKNPVKIQSVKNAFEKVFPNETLDFMGVEVNSGVQDQPIGEEETLLGAKTRALNAKSHKGDFWVGLEGGVAMNNGKLQAFAWMVVISNGKTGTGRTGSFYLPPRVSELVNQGMELGEADDIVFGQSDSKQKGGAVGLLTHGLLSRSQYYEQAVLLALIPFINEDLYF